MNDEIIKTDKCFVTWIKSDLYEDRGFNFIPLYVTALRETAERLGKDKIVHGSPYIISENDTFRINGVLYVPGVLIKPTEEDNILNEFRDKKISDTNKLKIIKELIQDIDIEDSRDIINSCAKLKELIKDL